jgi:hypothetical protein
MKKQSQLFQKMPKFWFYEKTFYNENILFFK